MNNDPAPAEEGSRLPSPFPAAGEGSVVAARLPSVEEDAEPHSAVPPVGSSVHPSANGTPSPGSVSAPVPPPLPAGKSGWRRREDDALLAPLLEELLGAAAPPDLVAEVYQRFNHPPPAPPVAASVGMATAVPVAAPATAWTPPGEDLPTHGLRRRRSGWNAAGWIRGGASGAVLAIGVVVGLAVWRPHPSGSTAQHPTLPTSPVSSGRGFVSGLWDPSARDPQRPALPSPAPKAGKVVVVPSSRVQNEAIAMRTGGPVDLQADGGDPLGMGGVPVVPNAAAGGPAGFAPGAVGSEPPRTPEGKILDRSPWGDPVRPLPGAEHVSLGGDGDVIGYINAALRKRWADQGLRPSPPATDGEWIRRLFLDLLGRIPTVEEARAFVDDRSPDKRSRWLSKIMGSEQYEGEFVHHWATIWTNLLIGRSAGMTPQQGVSRLGLHKFLRDALARNLSYDKLVTALVASEGVGQPGQPNFHGEVNFLLAHLHADRVAATTRVGQVFMGIRLHCMQCHNHPFNDWKQDQFWGINAFLTQVRREPLPGKTGVQRLVDRDYVADSGDAEEAEIYFETRGGLLKAAYPTFIDGAKASPSGRLDVVHRRRELARILVQSRAFRLAEVNRMWAHFLGYGFCHPVDDMGPHNPPSHPELFNRLAEDFAGVGYDVRRLIRWIVLSDAYGLSSRITPENAADAPENGETAQFARFYLRQMRPEELYASLQTATRQERDGGDDDDRERRRYDWLRQYVIDFETDENDETTLFTGTITQSLLMMNGELMLQATGAEPGSFLHFVQHSAGPDRGKLQQLYWAALARLPSPQEAAAAQALWQARQGDTAAALQDLWWALLNSNEFIVNH